MRRDALLDKLLTRTPLHLLEAPRQGQVRVHNRPKACDNWQPTEADVFLITHVSLTAVEIEYINGDATIRPLAWVLFNTQTASADVPGMAMLLLVAGARGYR